MRRLAHDLELCTPGVDLNSDRPLTVLVGRRAVRTESLFGRAAFLRSGDDSPTILDHQSFESVGSR